MTDNEKTVLEKLYDELRAELSTTQLNCDMWHDRAEDMRNRLSAAQVDNAKLRELVRDVYTLHWNGLDCTECPWFDECDTTGGCPWLSIFADHMRDLGVEVDA